jgi:glycosyltransferase involved in cell wall biosynthesis
VGNEIPSSIVRWHGARRIERFIGRLYDLAKEIDPDLLVTYGNFPTTEYLQLPFLDFMSFNVFLETRDRLEGYLARLQNIAGEKPLVMTEIGLDSVRHGEIHQAHTLRWQIESIFASGCAGACIFSWTDEWYRGGFEIEDWGFGLTNRRRSPKPALHAVKKVLSEVPFSSRRDLPMISVVVCSHNDGKTIRRCIESILAQEYPNFELIFVNDGSTDDTPRIASDYDLRLISIPKGGLSNARNVGMKAATGEIVAYLDGDAFPTPHWLDYLAHAFATTDHAGIGGPNIAPPSDGWIAKCVDHAPGGPNHVLFTDREAEHIPGCNMAFRKDALEAVDGFDTRFWIAGDDVDICWKLRANHGTLGYHPGAMVWHHCRNSVRDYLRQQFHYGKAEAMLELKWPEKYNSLGHLKWSGRMYSPGATRPLFFRRWRVYHGVWGSNLFQSIYMRSPGVLRSLPLTPEWYLMIASLVLISISGVLWKPLLMALPLLLVAIGILVIQAMASAADMTRDIRTVTRGERFQTRAMIAWLHLLQPVARLAGRLRFGLTPWRHSGSPRSAFPWPRTVTRWSETWRSPEDRLTELEGRLRKAGARVVRGSVYDRWDLTVRGGIFGGARIQMATEEHGQGRQNIRLRCQPMINSAGGGLLTAFVGLTTLVLMYRGPGAVVLLGIVSLLLSGWILRDCGTAIGACLVGIRGSDPWEGVSDAES